MEIKFEIFCPHCNRYSRRVPGEAAHSRLLSKLKGESTEAVMKCTHCDKEIKVTKITF
jgi:uncharacterized protein with PIN domain